MAEIYDRSCTSRDSPACSWTGPTCAHIFDQLRPLFDRGLLTPPAIKTWPLENSAEAYQTVLDGSDGIKQVLLPTGGGA